MRQSCIFCPSCYHMLPCAHTLGCWTYPWKGILSDWMDRWSRRGMLVPKRFKLWCNNLQNLVSFKFEAHNIFYHIMCMRWRWGLQNPRLGGRVVATSWAGPKVEWGREWPRLCDQAWGIGSSCNGLWVFNPPPLPKSPPRSLSRQDCHHKIHRNLGAYMSPTSSMATSFSSSYTSGASSSITSIATLFYLLLAIFVAVAICSNVEL